MTAKSGNHLAWTLAITSVASSMVALDALVVTTALPVVGHDLHAGMATLQWTVNTYGLTYAAGIITAAALGDRYGRRRVQVVLGYSPLTTGLRILPWTATPLLVAPAAGRLSDRIGRRPVLATGLLLQALGLGWFALVATGRADYAAMVAPLLVAGIGISMALPTVAAAAISAVRPQERGKTSGTNSTLQRLGAVFGVAIATTVFTAAGGTAATFTAGFRLALVAPAGLSLLGVCIALALRGRRAAVPAPALAPAA